MCCLKHSSHGTSPSKSITHFLIDSNSSFWLTSLHQNRVGYQKQRYLFLDYFYCLYVTVTCFVYRLWVNYYIILVQSCLFIYAYYKYLPRNYIIIVSLVLKYLKLQFQDIFFFCLNHEVVLSGPQLWEVPLSPQLKLISTCTESTRKG